MTTSRSAPPALGLRPPAVGVDEPALLALHLAASGPDALDPLSTLEWFPRDAAAITHEIGDGDAGARAAIVGEVDGRVVGYALTRGWTERGGLRVYLHLERVLPGRPSPDGGRRLESGGFAAAFAALRRSDVFGNVLAQSGGFGWRPEREREWGWLIRGFAQRPRLPVHFWLDVGRFETFPLLGPRPGDDGPGQLAANRSLRDVLRAKGYPVRYTEFAGGHDPIWRRGTLADGLRALHGPRGVGAPDDTPCQVGALALCCGRGRSRRVGRGSPRRACAR